MLGLGWLNNISRYEKQTFIASSTEVPYILQKVIVANRCICHIPLCVFRRKPNHKIHQIDVYSYNYVRGYFTEMAERCSDWRHRISRLLSKVNVNNMAMYSSQRIEQWCKRSYCFSVPIWIKTARNFTKIGNTADNNFVSDWSFSEARKRGKYS